MSAQQQQQQQQQQTAEKSVQTQELSNAANVVLTNSSHANIHAENTATEIAKTLVSLASGQQPLLNANKSPAIVNVSNSSSLPILSLADYTTSRGVPTATALATQAKLSPVKHEKVITHVDDDSTSMSTDEYGSNSTDPSMSSQTRTKTNRNRAARNASLSKLNKQSASDMIQYGPIVVKPRKGVAPTLASGRKSKDETLPPEEDVKRKMRRDRNKQAAAKCRRKRNELREQLEKAETVLNEEQKILQRNVDVLMQRKTELETLIRQSTSKKFRLSTSTNNVNTVNPTKTDSKPNPSNIILDPNGNGKRLTINITNPQDLFGVPQLSRVASVLTTTTSTNDGSSTSSSSTVPMITIHIIPEMAQALLGAATVDKTKLAEILQQVNTANATTTMTSMTNSISDPIVSNTDSIANSNS